MSMVRLQVGSIVPDEAQFSGEIPSTLERRALLVYAGTFQSMDGQVEVQDEHIERLAGNHNTLLKRLMTGLAGDLPVKFCPPIQLDHSLSAKDTVGRLMGLVEVGEHSDEGQVKKALYGKVKIMGRENVEKVLDGRWTHLSIGADLDEGKFQEVTITPFPAASNASLLSRDKLSSHKKVGSFNYKNYACSVYEMPPSRLGIFYYAAIDGETWTDNEHDAYKTKNEAIAALKKEIDNDATSMMSNARLADEKISYKGRYLYVRKKKNGDLDVLDLDGRKIWSLPAKGNPTKQDVLDWMKAEIDAGRFDDIEITSMMSRIAFKQKIPQQQWEQELSSLLGISVSDMYKKYSTRVIRAYYQNEMTSEEASKVLKHHDKEKTPYNKYPSSKFSQTEYRSLFEKTVNSVPGVRPTKVDVTATGAMAWYGDKERADQSAVLIESVDFFKSVKVKQESDNLWVVECKFSSVDGVKLNEGDVMFEKLKAYLVGFMKLSEHDAEKKLAEMPEDDKAKLMTEAEANQAKRDRMKGYLMAEKKMDDESAEKHLTEVSQEDLKKLEAEVDEHEKLAAKKESTEELSEEDKEKAKLRAEATEKFTQLTSGIGTRMASIKLAAKEGKITARLSSLKASMKITPAEIKKVDVKRLASQNDVTIEAVLKSYEMREPVIMTGLLGTKNAVNVAELEKVKMSKQMEKDIMSSMPFTSRLRKATLQEGEQECSPDKVEIHVDTDPHTDLMGEYDEVCKMMDEGKYDEAKAKLKKRYMASVPSYGAAMSEDAGSAHERMSLLEQELVKLHNEYEEMIKLTAAMRD